MSEIPLPQAVADLVKPISKNAPTGEDISRSEDPVANAAFADLEMDITKLGEIDYKKTAQMAVDILQKRSKHLRVAAWLCLSWFRLEGVEGLKNGLLVVLQLLQTFSDKLYPEKITQRSKAVQFLSMDKRFHTLEKMEITDPAVLKEIGSVFKEIDAECKTQFSDAPPDLSDLSKIIEARLKTAGEGADYQQPAIAEKVMEESAGTVTEIKSKPAESPTEESTAEIAEGEEPEETETEKELEIPNEVLDLLQDIKAESPVGENIEDSENQDAMVVYMSLESDISKYSNNNYPQCMAWAQEILQTRSKHLRVAIWLLISWFRTENLNGFRNGLQLIVEMMKKYGEQIFPADQKQKSRILQSLNTDTRIKLIDKVKADQQNIDIILEIGQIFTSLKEQSRILFPDAPSKLNAIDEIIREKAKEAQNIRDQDKKEAFPLEMGPEAAVEGEGGKAIPTARVDRPVSTSPVLAAGVNINDEKSAKIAIKKALQFYFQDGAEDSQKRKIPEDPTVYALSRVLRWSKLNQPADKDHITQVEGPNEPKQNFITKLYNNKDWDALIPELEINFITNDSFTFFLDAQLYIVKALEQKGGKFNEVASEVKVHLARLNAKFPQMTKLRFKDTKTPFASEETVKWIEEDVMNSLGGGKSKERILPPIMGEDYEPINKLYEEACEKLPQNFAENTKNMQQAIDGETRKKGRFLRLLNLANFCYLARKYPLAQPLFDQLMEQIEEYHISDWETALCVSVWQSTYLNNQKLLSNEKEDQKKAVIEKKQKELFDKIVKYDAVLALSLESHIQNEGE
jgi:type VI secretion system protein VasJ